MKSNKIILTVLILSIIVLPFSGCNGGGTIPTINHSPTIISLTADSSSININQSDTITCLATDQNNDPLTYTWTKSGGTITGTGSTITWTAPATTGTYTITCTVSDGELTNTQSIIITVLEPEGYAVSVTDSFGKASIVMENKQVDVNVKDEHGIPIPSVTVKAYALGEDVLIFAGSEDYLPGIKILSASEFSRSDSFGLSQFKPKFAVITITLMVLSIAGITMTVYEYYNNPGEFPVQIPGLIEGEKKVKSTCVQMDGNDLIGIGSTILSGLTLYKGVQVLGAPAQLRGVTAINYGFTKNMVTWTGAKTIGTAFVKLAGILDTDIINTCTYEYETNNGYEEMPYLNFDVQRSSEEEKIENAINGFAQALSDKDWDKARSYCVYGSVVYNEINEMEQGYYNDPSEWVDHIVVDNISPIIINGQYAEAYVYFTDVFIYNGEAEEYTGEQWHYLQKIGNDWKYYGYSNEQKNNLIEFKNIFMIKFEL